MQRNALLEPIQSSFLSCEKDVEIILNKTYYTFNNQTEQYQIVDNPDIADIDLYYEDNPYGNLSDRIGWLISVVDDNEDRHLYAFDYNDWSKKETDPEHTPSHVLYDNTPSYWYEILQISADMIKPERVVAIGPARAGTPAIPDGAFASSLMQNGLWFVTFQGHNHNLNG